MTAARSTNAAADHGEIDVARLKPQSRGQAHVEREMAEADALKRTDGRTLRRRGRTATLSTKTTPECVEMIHRIVKAEGMTMVEVIEKAVEMLDRHLRGVK
jgi:hypothetical protein